MIAIRSAVTLDVIVGHAVGAIVGKRAEVFGGVLLVGIGTAILIEHFTGS